MKTRDKWTAQRELLIQAMIKAEGGEKAFIRAVQISIPSVKTFEQAKEVAINTLTHLTWEYAVKDGYEGFVGYLGSIWAPIGAENDPTNLNKNWIPNVLKSLPRSTDQSPPAA